MWEELTMSEVWDILADTMPKELKRTFIKPDFPTRRWGKITTKTATSDKKSLEKVKTILTKCRIIKDKVQSEKYKISMYKIEIFKTNH